jgi:hypothetical protein
VSRDAGTKRFIRAFLRFTIGAILLTTAAGKLASLSGFARVLGNYQAFPERLLLPLAAAVSVAELFLAVWLFSGRRLLHAALAAAGMHFAYAVGAALTLARGIDVPNCGCFGVFLARPLASSTVVEDAALVAASLTLASISRASG